MGNAKGGKQGIPIDWEEVRIADNCVQTILKIQTLTNLIHQITEGGIVRHS